LGIGVGEKMLTVAQRKEIVKKFGKNENDSGSASVQVALLTERIKYLTPHFADHKHDHHSMRGLMKMIGSRRSLLRYIKNNDESKYQDLIKELGLRK
jgi:small subunit ribosomal protein S15